MQQIQLWGRGFKGKSVNSTAQRRINLYAEQPQEADGGAFILYSRPGSATLTRTFSGSAYVPATPACGLIVVNYRQTSGAYTEYGTSYREVHTEGWDFGRTLTEIFPSSSVTAPGPAFMDMAFNGNVVFAVNGTTGWWCPVNSPTSGIEANTIPGAFPWEGATSVTFLANRIIVNYPPVAGRFCWSPLNAFSGATWSGTDFANAESSPDALVAVRAYRGELLLFGTGTIEFWTPDATTTFSNIKGTTQQWGLVAQKSVQELGESMFFLGTTASGHPQICELRGYEVRPISTPDVEHVLVNDGLELSRASSSAFTIAGHRFYVLNLANTSLVWDATSNTWCEWQTDGKRWCIEFVAQGYNELLATDYRDGRVYTLDADTLTDGGQPFLKEFQSRHLFKNGDRQTLWELWIDLEQASTIAGIESSSPFTPTTWPPDTLMVFAQTQQLMLQISRDGGHTWGNEMWTTLGAIGQYLQRAVWRRLGRARDFTMRLRIADAVKVVMVRASVRVG